MAKNITLWASKRLTVKAYNSVEDSMTQVKAILNAAGLDESKINAEMQFLRINLSQVLMNNIELCVHMKRPEELVFAENSLAVHTFIVNVCKKYNVKKPKDLGLRVMVRRDYYELFASIDTRGWSTYMTGVVDSYLEMFTDDPGALKEPAVSVMKPVQLRLFTLSK